MNTTRFPPARRRHLTEQPGKQRRTGGYAAVKGATHCPLTCLLHQKPLAICGQLGSGKESVAQADTDGSEVDVVNRNRSAAAKDCRIQRPARLAADGQMNDLTLPDDTEALTVCERRKNYER
ncbi:hypothetical protein RBB78_24790 (plasmid) [Tunturiibacter empetritectus]|uniref:hypothetical protein n=1 Tax=Tunturiibacter empetritectus TaxID=3069691 RepID=UPI003D9BE2D2